MQYVLSEFLIERTTVVNSIHLGDFTKRDSVISVTFA